MASDRYLWCRNCGAIHRVTPSDRAPRYDCRGDEFIEQAANDWREFMNQHNGHRLEAMLATGHHHYPNGSLVDPMSIRYLEISNGRETLLLRRSRASIKEPFQYSVVEGRLIERPASLDIQEAAIRREMKLHFSWAPAVCLSDEKIDRFLGLFREVVRSLDPDSAPEPRYFETDGDVGYCELDGATVNTLLEKCALDFQQSELEGLRRFVETHRNADDVMALVKRCPLAIGDRAESSAC